MLLLSVPVVSDDPDVEDVPLLAPVAVAFADEEVNEVTEALPLDDEEPVGLALALALPVSEAVAEKETHAADPADWAWARSPALQAPSRQPAAWAPISDCEAQAQAWSVAGVQTAEMAEVRQGVCCVRWSQSICVDWGCWCTTRVKTRWDKSRGHRTGMWREAYSTGGLAFEACLGGGEAGGGNGDEHCGLHGVRD